MADIATSVASKALPVTRERTLRRVLGPEWQLGWLLVAPVVLIVSALLI
jgi:hypothetical protein